MKQVFLFFTGCLLVLGSVNTFAQPVTATFSVPQDTVRMTVVKTASPGDNITNLTGSNIQLSWHVVGSGTDFPADWLTSQAFGICDDFNCRANSSGYLWNEATGTGSTVTSIYYGNSAHDSVGGFSLSLDLTSATTLGTHYVTINLNDNTSGYSKNVTYAISKLVNTANVPSVTASDDKIILYPNPARDELNIVYDANADVKNVAIYNIIGKVMTVFKVSGDSANLNLENIPSGIYFVRLFNSGGNVVVTRKFTKQ